MNNRKFYKSVNDRKFMGVCGGLAQLLRVDSTVVRIICVFLCMFQPYFILIYFILAIVLPIDTSQNRENSSDCCGSNYKHWNINEKIPPGGHTPKSEYKNQANSSTAYTTAQNAHKAYNFEENSNKTYEQIYREYMANEPSYDSYASSQNQQAHKREDIKSPEAKPDNFGKILFAIMLICAGLGYFILTVIFNYSLAFHEVLRFAFIGLGLFLIVSGIFQNRSAKTPSIAKISFGAIITYFSVASFLRPRYVSVIDGAYLLSSIRFLWPILIICFGVNLLIPNKKLGTWLWILVILFILCMSIALQFQIL